MTQKFSEDAVSERRGSIVHAAETVFLRYGYARTTMGDIADAAGLSRPALYLSFPKKEDIFGAVVKSMNDTKLVEIREAMGSLRSFGRKLHYCCEEWGSHGVHLTAKHPDARDLFDLSRPAVRAMYDEFMGFLTELLTGGMTESKLKAKPRQLSRNLTFAMHGFVAVVTTEAEMREMISSEVDTVLAAIGC